MIAIVDYGVGNINAFLYIFKQLNIPAYKANSAEDLKRATKLILPGVGAFDHAMEKLNSSGMRETLDKMVLEQKVPVIGICVGMQMLANSSEEGKHAGLGWIDGTVKKFIPSRIPFKTKFPHMGWNDINPVKQSKLLETLEIDSQFYFLHSYYLVCNREEDVLATANYGEIFACIINYENIYGIQCHPEKSHQYGVTLLKNFANI